MGRMLLRRGGFGVITLVVVSIIVFLATQALPGDAARAILGKEATPERLAALRQQLGLDNSLATQYVHWVGNLFQFDLGTSLAAQRPVSEILGSAAVNTGILMILAAIIAIPLSIALGTLTAMAKDRMSDRVTSVITLIFAALPEFVVGILLVLLLSTGVLHIFPAVYVDSGGSVLLQPQQLVLPVLTLVLAIFPYITRIMRATVLEVLESEYVRQARLKGIPERLVIIRHAIPNAIGPVAQVIALQLAWLVGGVVLVEYLFRFPGVGFALTDAVTNRDMPLIQALVLLIAAFYVVVNLLADVVTLIANPRVRTANQ